MSRATKTIKKNFLKRRTKKIRRNLPKMSRELSLLTTTFPKCRAQKMPSLKINKTSENQKENKLKTQKFIKT